VRQRGDVIAFKDGVISDLQAEINRVEAFYTAEMSRRESDYSKELSNRDEEIQKKVKELSECKTEAHKMSRELESMLNSSSWKLTYPLRWISARLKGRLPRN